MPWYVCMHYSKVDMLGPLTMYLEVSKEQVIIIEVSFII